jgi:hypothetical protein
MARWLSPELYAELRRSARREERLGATRGPLPLHPSVVAEQAAMRAKHAAAHVSTARTSATKSPPVTATGVQAG